MFETKRLMCNPLQENCYVVSDDSGECVIIDCGTFYQSERDALSAYIRDNRLKPVHLLATHGHLDHNFGNADLWRDYGLKVEICAEDQELVEHLSQQAQNVFGITMDIGQAPTGRLLSDGDTITFGSHTLRVLHTPGHSHGSALFYCQQENVVFTGDTLFRMSIGRTDFAEGSWAEMEHSLRHVVARLPKETIVLSGHGPQSTMADELLYNPYLR
ncbi:MAG: MBL fold metallo-hydrolase [Prevotella sp.]|nr:MBL fold metallo-hydrolase [Prevotella sp.]